MTCNLPWEILASIVLAESFVIMHLVPFVTLGRSKEHKMIIGAARTCAKEIQISLKRLWENAQPGIHQVQNPVISTQPAHQVTVLPRQC